MPKEGITALCIKMGDKSITLPIDLFGTVNKDIMKEAMIQALKRTIPCVVALHASMTTTLKLIGEDPGSDVSEIGHQMITNAIVRTCAKEMKNIALGVNDAYIKVTGDKSGIIDLDAMDLSQFEDVVSEDNKPINLEIIDGSE